MKTIAKTLFSVIMVLFAVNAAAFHGHPPIKYGKILKQDLAMSNYKPDPDAPAVVLCDYGTVQVGPRTEYTRLVRIKILKDEGASYARVEIPFRSYEMYEKVLGLRGQTFNADASGNIIKTKARASDIQTVEVDNKNKIMILTLPNVKAGSVIEYSYTIASLDLVKLRDWYFQTSIPTLWSEYRLSVPFKFNYLLTYQKGKALAAEEQKAVAEKIQWLYDHQLKDIHYQLLDKDGLLYDSPSGNVSLSIIRDRNFRYVMRNLPAVHPNAGNPVADLSQQVKMHLYRAEGLFPFYYDYILSTAQEDYENWDRAEIRMNRNRRGYLAYWLPTWEEMNTNWLQNDNLGQRQIKTFNYKPLLDEALKNGDSNEQLARNIFEVVSTHIKWNGVNGIYANKDFDRVIKKQEGNGADINMILSVLLKRAGFSTDLILVKTKDKGRIENIYPVKDQFNHLVVQLVIGNRVWYLDATGNAPAFGKLPENVAGLDGWLLRKDNYGWVNLEEKVPDSAVTIL